MARQAYTRLMSSSDSNSESVARAFAAAISARDVAALARLMSDDHRFIDSLGNTVKGRSKMEEGWRSYFTMVPDYTITVAEAFASGGVVVMVGTAQGTFTADGKLKLENKWQTPAAWRAIVTGDHVTEWRVYADNDPIRKLMKSNLGA